MGPVKDVEVQSNEVGKEAYLSRLPQADQTNLQRIGEGFKKIMEEEEREGELVVVGGTLNKPLPRKDIDVLIVLQPHPTDVKKDTSTEFDFALKDFQTFQHLITNMVKQNPSLQIHEVFEPAIDEEFNSPGLLKTDGSIVVTSKETGVTPIEFVRISKRGNAQEIAGQDKRPSVILEHI